MHWQENVCKCPSWPIEVYDAKKNLKRPPVVFAESDRSILKFTGIFLSVEGPYKYTVQSQFSKHDLYLKKNLILSTRNKLEKINESSAYQCNEYQFMNNSFH